MSESAQQKQENKPQPIPSVVEFEPPLACVRRILKTSLPSSTNVGKDASAAFARACGIFIIYLTACANDFAREHKRQTITANDVLAAIKELDFEDFTPEMMKFLEAYRATEKSKKDAKAKAKKMDEEKEDESHANEEKEEESHNTPTKPDDEDAEDEDDEEGKEEAGAEKRPREEDAATEPVEDLPDPKRQKTDTEQEKE